MKYGESIFDILYLAFAITAGIMILIRGKSQASKMFGIAALFLGVGDAFHLVPRVLNYFSDADFTKWLGTGKLVTSVTMTLFYLILYFAYMSLFGKRSKAFHIAFFVLYWVRLALCVLPFNNWRSNESPYLWTILRNIPFVALGVLIVVLYYKKRNGEKTLGRVWLWTALSFLFYIPVFAAAEFVPLLGMLMIPKTVCYVLMLVAFLRYAKKSAAEEEEPGEIQTEETEDIQDAE